MSRPGERDSWFVDTHGPGLCQRWASDEPPRKRNIQSPRSRGLEPGRRVFESIMTVSIRSTRWITHTAVQIELREQLPRHKFTAMGLFTYSRLGVDEERPAAPCFCSSSRSA